MVYETSLLDPMWWVNSLIGNVTVLVAIVEIWLLSYIRKIPNIHTFAIILMGINIVLLFYGIFNGEGITLGQSLLGVMVVIFAIVAYSSYSDS